MSCIPDGRCLTLSNPVNVGHFNPTDLHRHMAIRIALLVMSKPRVKHHNKNRCLLINRSPEDKFFQCSTRSCLSGFASIT